LSVVVVVVVVVVVARLVNVPRKSDLRGVVGGIIRNDQWKDSGGVNCNGSPLVKAIVRKGTDEEPCFQRGPCDLRQAVKVNDCMVKGLKAPDSLEIEQQVQ
jgi:hypothetical protein